MNVTFLIGNGFDIGMGMHSKFSDYFPIYIALTRSQKNSLRGLADHIAENEENWSYFERQLGAYTNEFILETQKVLIEQIKDFEKGFTHYLREQEENLSFDNTQKIAHTMIDALLKYYSTDNLPIQSNEAISDVYSQYRDKNIVYNFINFNYTSVLESCLSTVPQGIVCKRKGSGVEHVDKIGRTVHVHGRNGHTPIMGVNDASQICNQELANDKKFTRFIVKPELNQYLRQNNDKNAAELLTQSAIICVYGMSLGETDKKWWSMILNWLYNNSKHQLILFDHDEKYSTSTQFEWLEKEDSIIDKFVQYNTNKAVDVEALRPRIHIAVNKNIFQMKLPAKKILAYIK